MDQTNPVAFDGAIQSHKPLTSAEKNLFEDSYNPKCGPGTKCMSASTEQTSLTFDNPYRNPESVGSLRQVDNFAGDPNYTFAKHDKPYKKLTYKELTPQDLEIINKKLEALQQNDPAQKKLDADKKPVKPIANEGSTEEVHGKKAPPLDMGHVPPKGDAATGKKPVAGDQAEPVKPVEVNGVLIFKYPDGSVKKVLKSEFENSPEKERKQEEAQRNWARKLLDQGNLSAAERAKLETLLAGKDSKEDK